MVVKNLTFGYLVSKIILLKYKYFSLTIHPSICGA